MTTHAKPEKAPVPFSQATCMGIMAIFLLCLLLKNAEIAVDHMRAGLRLCASTVIPSLFPFMVVSEWLVSSGIGNRRGRSARRFLGISGEALPAILLGALCGFPVGAKTAIALYDSGRLSGRETEWLLTFCNTPSPGFLISAVGISMFGCRSFGIFLYVAALGSSLAVGVLFRILRPIPRQEAIPSSFRPVTASASFSRGIASATSSMLSVCACVVFFTSVIGCLSHATDALCLPSAVEAFLFGIFEISSGVSAAADEPSAIRLALCGFAVGWSGISVHCQILSVGSGRGISFKPYFLSKVLQGLFCAAAAYVYGKRIAPDILASSEISGQPKSILFPLVVCLFFCICMLRYGKEKRKNSKISVTRFPLP